MRGLFNVRLIQHWELKTRRGGEHRRGEGSETFLERKWVLRRFPEVS